MSLTFIHNNSRGLALAIVALFLLSSMRPSYADNSSCAKQMTEAGQKNAANHLDSLSPKTHDNKRQGTPQNTNLLQFAATGATTKALVGLIPSGNAADKWSNFFQSAGSQLITTFLGQLPGVSQIMSGLIAQNNGQTVHGGSVNYACPGKTATRAEFRGHTP